MAQFVLRCAECGRQYDGASGFRLRCDRELSGEHGPALLRGEYETLRINVRNDLPGIFKFSDWLPTGRFYFNKTSDVLAAPVCYRSEGLAGRLGLKNLYVAFSGYWPERKAELVTRTFKEFEVQTSIPYFLQSFRENGAPPFIIASAGNTGNAYNFYTHLLGLPLYLFVPEDGLGNLLLPFKTSPTLISVNGDYTDAIILADSVADRLGMVRDGGVRNIGRRAGMGTVMLNAVVDSNQGSGRLFDHYFQAVGSGSGAIAAWEAVHLLLRDGRFGDTPTRIHMAQNAPFTPISRAWREGRRDLAPLSEEDAHRQVAMVTAGVLTNRHPPFAVRGGLRDVLTESGGMTWQVSNAAVFQAARMFRSLEGVDIGPAAAVAVDSLNQAVLAGEVRPKDFVLLHITGGGREIQYSSQLVQRARPTATIEPGDLAGALSIIGTPKEIPRERIVDVLKPY